VLLIKGSISTFGHLQNERAARHNNAFLTGNPLPKYPGDYEPIPGRFDERVKMWRRLCCQLTADDAKLTSSMDRMLSQLFPATDCRHDIAHGWISRSEDGTSIKTYNHSDMIKYHKIMSKFSGPEGLKHRDEKRPRVEDYLYATHTIEYLASLPEKLQSIFDEIYRLSEAAITDFRAEYDPRARRSNP
jgi:hypothetical protein